MDHKWTDWCRVHADLITYNDSSIGAIVEGCIQIGAIYFIAVRTFAYYPILFKSSEREKRRGAVTTVDIDGLSVNIYLRTMRE